MSGDFSVSAQCLHAANKAYRALFQLRRTVASRSPRGPLTALQRKRETTTGVLQPVLVTLPPKRQSGTRKGSEDFHQNDYWHEVSFLQGKIEQAGVVLT